MHKRNRLFVSIALVYGLLGGLIAIVRLIDPSLIPGNVPRAHGHIMLLGFILMTIYGIALHVLPRFGGFPLYSEQMADWQLYTANAGLPLMIAGALAYSLCWLPLLFGVQLSAAAGYSLFFAMGLFAPSFTLSWSCAKEVNPPALSGMSTSVVNVGAFLGTAIMQPLVGWAIDRAHAGSPSAPLDLGDYQSGIAILLAFSLMGLIATLFIRETYCRYAETGQID